MISDDADMPPVTEDAILEIFELREAFESCDAVSDEISGVLLAAGRSSTFLAMATVSACADAIVLMPWSDRNSTFKLPLTMSILAFICAGTAV